MKLNFFWENGSLKINFQTVLMPLIQQAD